MRNQPLTHEFRKGIALWFAELGGETQLRRHRGFFRLSLDGQSVEARDEFGRNEYRFCSINSLLEFWEIDE